MADDDTPASLSGTGWVNVKGAAHYLGITPRTLYRLIDEGQIPAYRMGRVIRLRHHELDDFIESARIKPGDLAHLYPPVGSGDD